MILGDFLNYFGGTSSFYTLFAFFLSLTRGIFEKRSLSFQHVFVLKEESNMGMQLEFSFGGEESNRLLATLDEETLITIVELMARMVVRVQEKRKEKKHG